MIRVTKKAIKLTLDNNFFALTFHHADFHTVSASSFIATFQEYRFSALEIKVTLADGAFEF